MEKLYMKNTGIRMVIVSSFIWCVIFLSSCSALQQEEKSNVYEVLKSQEIRQLTSADVMHASQLFGESVFSFLDSTGMMCDRPTLDSIGKSFDGTLSLSNSVSGFRLKQEKDLFEAYQYNIENNVISKNSIQRLDDRMAVYTIPFIGNQHCVELDSTFYMLSIIFPTKAAINRLD